MLSFIKKKIKKKIRKLFFYAFSEMDEGREYPLLKDRMVKAFPELALLTTDARSVITDYLIRSHAGKNTKFYSPYHISDAEIGDYTYVAPNAYISMATIGKFCSIGPNLICGWGIHPLEGISTHPMFFSTLKQNGMTLSQEDKCVERQAITIGHDVLIGANVTILDGVTIGNGAVIGAGAVVSKDIPPYAVAVGCPIKIIRYRFDEETRQKMEMSQWWDRDEEGLKEIERNIFNVKEILR